MTSHPLTLELLGHREFMVLYMLSRQEHAIDPYALCKLLRYQLPSFELCSRSQINITLTRLNARGLAGVQGTAMGKTGHRMRLYRITPEGQSALVEQAHVGATDKSIVQESLIRFTERLLVVRALAPGQADRLLQQRMHCLMQCITVGYPEFQAEIIALAEADARAFAGRAH